jgi:DNA-binding NtrC family response regulator
MTKSRVLIVDDSAEMARTISKYLTAHGFDTTTATNGDDAIEAVRISPPAVVITDLRMNGLDGLDVLEIIRKSDPNLPIIIMTAFGTVENAVEATHRGAFHYLTKPFKLATLRALLEQAMSLRVPGPLVSQNASPQSPVPPSLSSAANQDARRVGASEGAAEGTSSPPDPFVAIARQALSLREVEMLYTEAVLASVAGNKTRAAEILGVHLSTLYRRGLRNEPA